MSSPLVQAQNLKKYFKIKGRGELHAVDDVSFTINEGETFGLVGESGCGKSTIGNLVMRLLDPTEGKLLYRGKNIYESSREEKTELCKKMQIIFQDPYSSLNPRKPSAAFSGNPIRFRKSENQRKNRRCLSANCATESAFPTAYWTIFPTSWMAVCARLWESHVPFRYRRIS